MRNRRKPGRHALYEHIAGKAIAEGYTLIDVPGRTARGTRLEEWLRPISRDGVVPDCGHAVPGMPAVLCTDDPEPMVRCLRCTAGLAGLRDDRTCHLCGRESAVFREFTVKGTGQLIIAGNARPECFVGIRRGNPVAS